MNPRRRDLLAGSAAAALASPIAAATSVASPATRSNAERFRLNYAPHLGMFRHLAGDDPLDQIRFMADQGFTAFEDNGMRGRPIELQEQIGDLLDQLGLTMGVFVCNTNGFGQPSFTSGDEAARDQFVADARESVEIAKRVNAKWCTVVMGDLKHNLEMDYQTANAIETLKRGAAVCEPSGLIMVIEPLNPWANHPGMFLTKIPQAYLVCKAVDSPSVKILNDLYHQQITEGNLIPNIDKAYDETAYFQVGDNPGRKEPTTGEINYLNVFRHIHAKGFTGVIGMEHGNSAAGPAGEQAVIDAYRAVDSF